MPRNISLFEGARFMIEIIALLLATSALIFNGIQTRALVEGQKAPFQSNLHARQIDTCERIISQYSLWVRELPINEEEFERIVTEIDGNRELSESERGWYSGGILDRLLANVNPNHRELIRTTFELDALSGLEMREKIAVLQEGLFFMDMLEFEAELQRYHLSPNPPEPHFFARGARRFDRPSNDAFEAIRTRCSAAINGEVLGML